MEVKDIIAQLKALPFTVRLEQDTHGVFGEVVEFPEEFEEEATQDKTIKALAKGLKGWASVLARDVDGWRKGREEEVPYLLKILVSTEQELEECLRSGM